MEKILVQGDDVLDLGCGDGRYSFSLMGKGAGSVIGLDVSEEMINLARKRNEVASNSKVTFVLGDAEDLPYSSPLFNGCFSNFVLHYFKNLDEVFIGIANTLKTNGWLIATMNIAEITDVSIGNEIMPILLGDTVEVETLIKTDQDVFSALESANLKLVLYEELNNEYLKIKPSYIHKDKISKFKNIVVVAKKVAPF